MGVAALMSMMIAAACDDGPAPEPEARSSVDPAALDASRAAPQPRAEGDKFRVVLMADPQPEAVFVLGDLVTSAHRSQDLGYYDDKVTAWSISADLFEGFDAPVYPLFGDHDYGGFDCDTPDDVYFEWHPEMFDKSYGQAPYYKVDLHGFRFLLLDGQQGLRCQDKTGEAAFGRTQLDWVADQADEGLPTFVLTHYMSLIWSIDMRQLITSTATLWG